MTSYDKYYKKENYFGRPCPKLMDLFEAFPRRGSLCDLGAGQGRNAIPLQKMGYSVTAVDISKVGLAQISIRLPDVTIVESDLYTFDISKFDFILLDSIIHFYKKDIGKETGLVEKILSEMKHESILVNNMIKSAKAEKHLKDIFNSFHGNVKLLADKHIDCPDLNTKYHLTAANKL